MVTIMATRRAALALLAILFVMGTALPASAGHRRHATPRVTITAEGPGTLIALRYTCGHVEHVRFVHAREPIERVALADLDNDGRLDIVAAPRDGALMVWHNAGNGRFAPVALPHGAQRISPRSPRFSRVGRADDGWQWGDDRYDAAMPRAPDVVAVVPVSLVRVSSFVPVRPVSLHRSFGRAPPVF